MNSYREEYYRWVGVVQGLVARREARMAGLRALVQGQLDNDLRVGMYRSASRSELARLLEAKYQEYVDKDIEVRGLSGEIRDAQQAAIMYAFGALMEQPTPIRIPVPR